MARRGGESNDQSMSRPAERLRFATLAFLFLLQSCTHLNIEDCGGTVLGRQEDRIRSSHWRMLLADTPAAAARFLPYAAMSALAYAEDADCGNDPKLNQQERDALEKLLADANWREVKEVEWAGACEDDTGLFYRVWKKDSAGSVDVVIAFRGTWGMKDWLYGNLHWFTRFLPLDDQYKRAREYSARVIRQFQENAPATTRTKPVRFTTTGHSLGGGLAQHILYSFPDLIIQAHAFAPSSATGFADQTVENQVAACACDRKELKGEARIYRIYDSYEILANLRIFHKLFFDPERHIQEVRFDNEHSHSMKELAFFLSREAGRKNRSAFSEPWYAGLGNVADTTQSCTDAFIEAQAQSCSAKVTPDDQRRCPQ
ncbi:MAG: lipase family protein [Noviherbaspirillum sp.]